MLIQIDNSIDNYNNLLFQVKEVIFEIFACM